MDAPSELFLISAIIRSGDVLEPAQRGITPAHFHNYRAEYEWILDYRSKYSKAPSKTAFKTAFPDFTLLRADDLEYAVDEVKRNHTRHEVTKALKEATEFLRMDQPTEALGFLTQSTRQIQRDVMDDSRAVNVIEDWEDLYEDVSAKVSRADSDGITGVTTGLPTLDERTYGAQPGDLWIIAARLGQGKTWVLCRMAEASLIAGKKVLFVSMEQTYRQVTYRIHTILGNRFGYKLRNTALSSGLGVDLISYKEFLHELPDKVPGQLVVVDGGRGRISPITLAAMIEENEPDVVLVDYITLMATSSGQQATEDWRAAASISADVKLVAMQYDVPIVCAAQINRLGEGGKRPPGVDKLAQSDSLGQDASVVVTMRRGSSHTAQFSLEKNRHGEEGSIFWTSFKPDKGEFEEISREKALSVIMDDTVEES